VYLIDVFYPVYLFFGAAVAISLLLGGLARLMSSTLNEIVEAQPTEGERHRVNRESVKKAKRRIQFSD